MDQPAQRLKEKYVENGTSDWAIYPGDLLGLPDLEVIHGDDIVIWKDYGDLRTDEKELENLARGTGKVSQIGEILEGFWHEPISRQETLDPENTRRFYFGTQAALSTGDGSAGFGLTYQQDQQLASELQEILSSSSQQEPSSSYLHF